MFRRLWDQFILWLLADIDAGRSAGAQPDAGDRAHDSGAAYDAGGGNSGISL